MTQRPSTPSPCDWPQCPLPSHYTLTWDTPVQGYDRNTVQACARHVGQWRSAWAEAKEAHKETKVALTKAVHEPRAVIWRREQEQTEGITQRQVDAPRASAEEQRD